MSPESNLSIMDGALEALLLKNQENVYLKIENTAHGRSWKIAYLDDVQEVQKRLLLKPAHAVNSPIYVDGKALCQLLKKAAVKGNDSSPLYNSFITNPKVIEVAKILYGHKLNLSEQFHQVTDEMRANFPKNIGSYFEQPRLLAFIMESLHTELKRVTTKHDNDSVQSKGARYEEEIKFIQFAIQGAHNYLKQHPSFFSKSNPIKEIFLKHLNSIHPLFVTLGPERQGKLQSALIEALKALKEIFPPLAKPFELPHQDLGENAVGLRTVMMRNWLPQLKEYSQKDKILKYNNKDFRFMTGKVMNFSKTPLINCGAGDNREIIVFDPENSPYLDKLYHTLVAQLTQVYKSDSKPLKMQQVLASFIPFVRKELFPSCNKGNCVQTTENFTRNWLMQNKATLKTMDGRKIAMIPLDQFIANGQGVCRHHGMAACILLDRLVKEHGGVLIPKGIVQSVRDHVPGGAHQWLAYTCENGDKWHIDTLWNKFENFIHPQALQRLINAYGNGAISHEIRNTDIAAAHLNKAK